MSGARPQLEAMRRRRLKAIHVGRRQLGLDEDAWRGLLERVTGQRSAAGLDLDQLADVIEELRRHGFTARRRELPSAQQRKIAAIWADLHAGGAVKDGSPKALDAFVKRQTGIDSLRWLPPEGCNKVIEALKAWQSRAAAG
jgi:phage gp16-like protein